MLSGIFFDMPSDLWLVERKMWEIIQCAPIFSFLFACFLFSCCTFTLLLPCLMKRRFIIIIFAIFIIIIIIFEQDCKCKDELGCNLPEINGREVGKPWFAGTARFNDVMSGNQLSFYYSCWCCWHRCRWRTRWWWCRRRWWIRCQFWWLHWRRDKQKASGLSLPPPRPIHTTTVT